LYLFGKRQKSLSINTPIAKGKVPISDARALELLPLIIEGDKGAAEEFAEGMLSLAVCIIGQYVAHRRNALSELMSAGLYGLANAIDRVRNGDLVDSNIKAFCISCIHSECADFFKSKPVFGPGPLTVRAKPETAFVRIPFIDAATGLSATNDLEVTIFTRSQMRRFTIEDVFSIVHVLDEREKVIFDMVAEGWELKDISEAVGQKYKKIYDIWQGARRKLIKALQDAEA
jgi:RNA polymerase sigma factor (sigma-70 family)